jgi:branched-chain amino acid transport system substrate-binding protein
LTPVTRCAAGPRARACGRASTGLHAAPPGGAPIDGAAAGAIPFTQLRRRRAESCETGELSHGDPLSGSLLMDRSVLRQSVLSSRRQQVDHVDEVDPSDSSKRTSGEETGMAKKRLGRRGFLKLTGSASILAAAGAAFPGGAFAATPRIKGPIKIGYQTVLSGTLAGYGEFHKMGALMALEEINGKGGIAGQKVELDIRDSTMKPDDAIKNVRYHVDSWEADFLAGIDSSGQALAVAPLMPQLDKVLIVTHAATEKLTEDQVFKKGVRQIFRICAPTYQDGNAAAFVAKDLPVTKWATVSPKYEYGFTCWKMFQDTLGKLKKGVTFATESFAPAGTTDFRSHINTIMDAQPEGLYSTEWAGELITFVKQAREAGLFEKVKAVMFPVGAAMDVLEGTGADLPDGVWISGRYYFLYPDTKTNKDWVARFHARWKHYPAYVSETAYSSLFAIKAAVEKAGSKETKPVIQALEGMEMDSPAGRRVFRKEDHQAIYEVPWGKTRSDPKYPFKIMGEQKVIPASVCYNRPPFEGAASYPPFAS